ncbi:MAG: hypothetical protein PWP04_850 [Candidatus Atribacteria bacterium]|nr:hypothetical protein [Candidatus Atribacteria bacterium]
MDRRPCPFGAADNNENGTPSPSEGEGKAVLDARLLISGMTEKGYNVEN